MSQGYRTGVHVEPCKCPLLGREATRSTIATAHGRTSLASTAKAQSSEVRRRQERVPSHAGTIKVTAHVCLDFEPTEGSTAAEARNNFRTPQKEKSAKRQIYLTYTLSGAISTLPLTSNGKTKLDSATTARSPRRQDDSKLESALTRWYTLCMVVTYSCDVAHVTLRLRKAIQFQKRHISQTSFCDGSR